MPNHLKPFRATAEQLVVTSGLFRKRDSTLEKCFSFILFLFGRLLKNTHNTANALVNAAVLYNIPDIPKRPPRVVGEVTPVAPSVSQAPDDRFVAR